MMQVRQDDLDKLMDHKEQLKQVLEEMEQIQNETKAALEGQFWQKISKKSLFLELKKAPMPQAGNTEKTTQKLDEYSNNMGQYFSLVREEQLKPKKKCSLMWKCTLEVLEKCHLPLVFIRSWSNAYFEIFALIV